MKKIIVLLSVLFCMMSFSISTAYATGGFGGGSHGGSFGTGGFDSNTVGTQVSYSELTSLCTDINIAISNGYFDSLDLFSSTTDHLAAFIRVIPGSSDEPDVYVISLKKGNVYHNWTNNSGGVYYAVAETDNDAELGPIMSVLRSIYNYISSIITQLSNILARLDLIKNAINTVSERIYSLLGKVDTVIGHVDGLEGLITTANTRLNTLIGHVDGVEGSLDVISRRLLKTVGSTNYSLSDLSYNTWQQLRSIGDYLDGVEGLIGTTNTRLSSVVSSFGKVDTVIDVLKENHYYCSFQTDSNDAAYPTFTIPYDVGTQIVSRLNSDMAGKEITRFKRDGSGPTSTTYTVVRAVLLSSGYIRVYITADNTESSYYLCDENNNLFLVSSRLDYSSSLTAAVSFLNSIDYKLDSIISSLNNHTVVDVAVDLGDVSLTSDDSMISAYLKVLAYGQVDMYSILGSIAAEYRTASPTEQDHMDTILSKYWYSPGTAPYSLTVTGDQLRNIQQRMIEIGYPCTIVKDQTLDAYVIQLTGNPRVADVLNWTTSIYSGKQDLYVSGSPYYLTQGGILLKASGKASILAFEDFTTNFTYHITHMSGQLDAQLTHIVNTVDRLDSILDILEDNFSYSGSDHLHTYESEVVQEATCTAPGLISYKCSECGFTYSEILPSLGHAWDLTEHGDAVLDEEGNELSSQYDIYTCTRCGVTQRTYDGSEPESGSDTSLSELIANIFARLGSFVGELFSTIFDFIDQLFIKFDSLCSSFSESADQIVSFGGEYPEWLAGIWDYVPEELQIALTFCLIVSLIGIVGKKLIFA